MLVRVKEYIRLKRRSKRFMFGFVVFMLSVITSFSYAVFMISTDKYRASEMFIANLMYGINISDSDNTSTISGKQVTVGVGTTEIVNVTVTSLNPVDSNYKLQYKIISGSGHVYYSDRTNWKPYGFISQSNEGVYVKTIKIVIENTGSGNLTIELGASGGYSYNSVNSVALISGYTAITEEKATIIAVGNGELITNVIEDDTSCDTSTTGVCLYGGESKNNYLQYPETDNKSENIWRIMGTYSVDGTVVAKMISETSTTSTYTNAVPNLNSFYNSLEDVSSYIFPTNKFLCTGNNITCAASSKFSNIGLINVDEYNKIGGINSYLGSTSSYFSMTEANSLVSNITSSGIQNVSFDTSSGLRGVVYVQDDVRVTGSGTASDPFVFTPKGDVNVIAWTLDGVEQSGDMPGKGDGYVVAGVTCTNGATAEWNNSTWGIIVGNITDVPTNCTINFKTPQYLYAQILEDNPNVSTRTDFSSVFTTSNNGNTIYKASGQDGKDTYYFAGQVTNNYVYFANKYWRIVRINEDNSVRLIYAGTSATDTAAFISTSQAYNSSYNNSAYVGYMYTASQQHGTGTNSPIKTRIDNWYASNLSSYSGYISKTAIYCNDRTVGSGTWSATGSDFYYAARERLYTNKAPSFVCSNANNRFTASTTTGNGKLTYPIGLITADEISYAGGLYGTNNTSYYIAQNASSGASYWWTMSPSLWSGGNAYVFVVGGSFDSGSLSSGGVYNADGVRPVISLKSCVLASGGDGTASNPYTVELADGCANVDNEILEENTVRVSATTNDTSMATVNAPSSVIINSGGSYTFTFNVKDNYVYESVTGCNGTYNTGNNTLTVSNVTSTTTCQVNFRPNTYTVTMVGTNGSLSPTSSTVNNGASATFTATPNTGYTTTGATVSCTNGISGSISGSTVTVSNVTSNTTCTVNFKILTYTVSAAPNSTSYATVVAPSSVSVNYGSSYTFTFNVKSGYEYSSLSNCTGGSYNTSTNKLTVSNVTTSTTCQVNFKEKVPTFAETILADNPNVSTRSSFSSIFTTSNNGNTIYKASGQDGKTTYYFAGQVTNNYVKFANKYWRIVRINEDNSVRLIYAGTSASDTAAFINTSQAYNSSSNNSAYVGYMYTASQQYGTGTNSSIKTVVDNWYSSNLNSYSGYISKTAIYCNDRTVGSGSWSATGNTFRYAAHTRLIDNKTPTFACSNANDRFTASTSTGNGKLTYPIGLITADEISYAGGVYGTNSSNYYIAQNASSGASFWWTMSPLYWYGNSSYAYVFIVGGSFLTGHLFNDLVNHSHGVRPVISLKSCVLASGGDGTASNPYTVELPSACSRAAN